MSQILFIADAPCIQALVENLQMFVKSTIVVEANYTGGLRRLFDTRPAAVFLQHMIAELSCDKLANQVKLLLDGDPIPLVLLSEQPALGCGTNSPYNACFDLCLPVQELCLRARLFLNTQTAVLWWEPLPAELLLPGEPAPDDGQTGSLKQPPPPHEQVPLEADTPLEGFDSDALPFSPETPASLPSVPSDSPDDLLGIEPVHLVFETRIQQGTAAPRTARENSLRDLQRMERQAPGLLFEGISTAAADRPTVPPEPPPQRPSAVPRSATTPPRRGDGASSAAAVLLRAAVLPEAKRTWCPDGTLPDEVAARRGLPKKAPSYARVVVAGLLLVLGGAGLDLYLAGRSPTSQTAPKPIQQPGASLNAPPQAPRTVKVAPLPQFIPQVAPDSDYAANNPGWERYHADALEYLVYREKDSIRAIQVIGERPGAISLPFLKTCIRLVTGQEQYAAGGTELRGGMRISTGTLKNGGELLVYRTVRDEISGFVLTFPSGPP